MSAVRAARPALFETDADARTRCDIRVGAADPVRMPVGVYAPAVRKAIDEVDIEPPAADSLFAIFRDAATH